MTPFDLAHTPPPGLTVLEASAGTGKTFSLAGLTVLGLARGTITTRELCVVTFTEAATAELAGRFRSRIADAAELLHHGTVGDEQHDDPVDALLVDADESERRRRAERLDIALAEFDAVTISTIHGFCHRLLTAAGAESVDIRSDSSDISEVVHDQILARQLDVASPDSIVSAVELRLALPDSRLATRTTARDSDRTVLDETIGLVEECVTEVLARRRRWRRRTFDSMISETRDLVTDPHSGPALVAELRARFRLVLIDEFQDTDRVQWDIFRTAFLDADQPGPRAAVVVVGDPKQSIYRFRGAELSAYLAAIDYSAATGGKLYTLDTNWRSDPSLLSAIATVFDGAAFGDESVRFHTVRAGRVDDRRIDDPASASALRIRTCHPGTGKVLVDDARLAVRRDLVSEVVRLLDDTTIVRRPGADPTRLQPSDIGILVRSNSDADVITEALRACGVPAVTSSGQSVLDSPAAHHWRTLLAALCEPGALGLARAAAIGAFGSLDPADLATLDDVGESALLDRHQRLVDSLRVGGMPRLIADLRHLGYQHRILSHRGGERLLTDIDHVAELLQRITAGRPCSPARLAAALRELGDLSTGASSRDLLDRRLDRDDETVTVMTIHKAKGLEFPVVLCPYLWTTKPQRRGIGHAHVPDHDRRLLDTRRVAGMSSSKAVGDVNVLAVAEENGEQSRLLYVALTRAVHRLIVWEVPDYKPKGVQQWRRLLDDACRFDLAALAAASEGTISLETAPASPPVRVHTPDTAARTTPVPASFDRTLTDTWRVWSFSSIERTAAIDHQRIVPPEPPQLPPLTAGGTDEPDTELHDGPSGTTLRTVRGSATFGTFVHEVLENVDFTSPSLDDDLAAACAAGLAARPMPIGASALASGLAAAVRTPLGGPAGTVRLADIAPADRLDELEFHLPLSACSALDIAAAVTSELPDDDPMRPWFAAAARGLLDVDIDGILTGSIDLAARVDGRYLVADYKTNRIAAGATFTRDEMVTEMHRQGYPLQAVLYLVALRRYLRHRTGTDGPVELLGAAYLFVRGMDPQRPSPDSANGVLWWSPPATVLDVLDHLFDTGALR